MWIAFGNVLGTLYLVDISWFEAPGASEQMAARSQEVVSALDCMNIQYDVDAASSGKGQVCSILPQFKNCIMLV